MNTNQRRACEEIVATGQRLGTAKGLSQALRNLEESPLADQVAVAIALKAKAYTDPTIAERIWEVISDADWRMDGTRRLSGNALFPKLFVMPEKIILNISIQFLRACLDFGKNCYSRTAS